MAESLAAFFESDAFETAATTAVTSAAVGYGVNALNKPKISVPPPPGAAMVDQQGAAAAAANKRRQAIAGGLQGTLGAGASPQTAATFGSVTSGSKQLSGQ